MASVSSRATCAADSRFAITANFSVTEVDKSANASNNTSKVSWHLTVTGSGQQNLSFSGSSRSHAGWVYCAVNGTVVFSGYTGLPHGFTNGTKLIDKSGTVTVTHENDGTKSCGFYVDLDGSDDDYGRINWKFNDGPRSSGSISLTTIPRASQPSMNTWPNNSENVTAGVQCYVHMNRKSTNFTHKVYYTWKDGTHRTAGLAQTSGITNNVAWTPPVDLCKDFTNSKTGWGTMYAETYNGSTLIGTKSCKFTVNLPSDAQPTVSATCKETGTLADGKTLLTDIGVNDTTYVSFLSKKVITVTASAKYYSTIKQIICKHGGDTKSSTSNPATFTFNESEYGGSSSFDWSAVDSRGNTVSGSINMTAVYYNKPSVYTITPSRDTNVVDTGKLNADGNYFYGHIGNLSNDIKVSVNYAGKTVNIPSGSISKSSDDQFGKNWQIDNYAINGVSPDNAYKFTVTVTDSVGFSSSKDATLAQAIPTLWLGKRTARVNDFLIVNNAIMVSGQNVRSYKVVGVEEALIPGLVTTSGGEIVDARRMERIITEENCPEGFEFVCILQCSPLNWKGNAYALYPNAGSGGTSVYGYAIGSVPSSPSLYIVALYQSSDKTDTDE